MTREYLSRKGGARFNPDAFERSRCSLLGFSPVGVKIDGVFVSRRLIHTNLQPDVGSEGYDAGAKLLADFFKNEVKKFLVPELNPLGRKIIHACMEDAKAEDYAALIPAPVR
jgi:hypothetical protein